ncbi:YHYH domain-containing protein [Paenibacillus wynnii]|uniref:YHYH domain-containing protein n=1 Tax=Paenibacillus wynnii TaxID=268407 RepID=UPI000A541A5A|nr:YHYH domain-containing protein [Paenibacillus wynnii]
MKKTFMVLIVLVVFVGTSSSAMAHSGRTDKKGGHNCSAKSKQKGLCSGYHYHNKK